MRPTDLGAQFVLKPQGTRTMSYCGAHVIPTSLGATFLPTRFSHTTKKTTLETTWPRSRARPAITGLPDRRPARGGRKDGDPSFNRG